MDKLNELVELAKKADREVTWSLLPFDLAKEGWCVEVVNYVAAMNPHDILAIAEAFRELEQRAEAVDAQVAELAKQKPVAVVEESDYATVVEMVEGNRRKAIRELQEGSLQLGMELFTRAAPAAVPVDWVPDSASMSDYYDVVKNSSTVEPEEAGILMWDACRDEMLRRIEGLK